MRHALAAVLLAMLPLPAPAQLHSWMRLGYVNRGLRGRVVDYTANHGQDCRIYSPLLRQKRDMYVYLPPGYTPAAAYPLVLWCHGAFEDEHSFPDIGQLRFLDEQIGCGRVPPVIVACPDATYCGENRLDGEHSLFLNGCGGPMADHVWKEVIPFLLSRYPVRPEREAHATCGVSAGGFSAVNLALKNPAFFGHAVSLYGPLDVRLWDCDGDLWRPALCPFGCLGTTAVLEANYYRSLGRRIMARRTVVEPSLDCPPGEAVRIAAENPANLVVREAAAARQVNLLVSYGDRDLLQFDGQSESFLCHARQAGVPVSVDYSPTGRHRWPDMRQAQRQAWLWLGQRLPPPSGAACR